MAEKTCYDCFHKDVCENRSCWIDPNDSSKHTICHHFKNTADVVPREEVAKIFECLEPNFAIGEFTGSDVFYAIRVEDYNRCKKKYTEVESNG